MKLAAVACLMLEASLAGCLSQDVLFVVLPECRFPDALLLAMSLPLLADLLAQVLWDVLSVDPQKLGGCLMLEASLPRAMVPGCLSREVLFVVLPECRFPDALLLAMSLPLLADLLAQVLWDVLSVDPQKLGGCLMLEASLLLAMVAGCLSQDVLFVVLPECRFPVALLLAMSLPLLADLLAQVLWDVLSVDPQKLGGCLMPEASLLLAVVPGCLSQDVLFVVLPECRFPDALLLAMSLPLLADLFGEVLWDVLSVDPQKLGGCLTLEASLPRAVVPGCLSREVLFVVLPECRFPVALLLAMSLPLLADLLAQVLWDVLSVDPQKLGGCLMLGASLSLAVVAGSLSQDVLFVVLPECRFPDALLLAMSLPLLADLLAQVLWDVLSVDPQKLGGCLMLEASLLLAVVAGCLSQDVLFVVLPECRFPVALLLAMSLPLLADLLAQVLWDVLSVDPQKLGGCLMLEASLLLAVVAGCLSQDVLFVVLPECRFPDALLLAMSLPLLADLLAQVLWDVLSVDPQKLGGCLMLEASLPRAVVPGCLSREVLFVVLPECRFPVALLLAMSLPLLADLLAQVLWDVLSVDPQKLGGCLMLEASLLLALVAGCLSQDVLFVVLPECRFPDALLLAMSLPLLADLLAQVLWDVLSVDPQKLGGCLTLEASLPRAVVPGCLSREVLFVVLPECRFPDALLLAMSLPLLADLLAQGPARLLGAERVKLSAGCLLLPFAGATVWHELDLPGAPCTSVFSFL